MGSGRCPAPGRASASGRSELKGSDRTAYAIADNRSSELAEWDLELLSAELGELQAGGMDLELTGFDEGELAAMGPPPEIVEDEVPDPPADPITKPGDLWLCGDHRVLCGDSTKGEDVARVMDGGKPALCLTDPPCGVEYSYESHKDSPSNLETLIEAAVLPAIELCDVAMITCGNGNQHRYPMPTWTLSWQYHGIGRGPWGFTCWQPVLAYGKDPYLASGQGCRPDSISGLSNDPDPKDISALMPETYRSVGVDTEARNC